MNKIKFNPYYNLTNEQLIDFTIEEMDRLKILSMEEDTSEYQKGVYIVNQLIIEVKRRNISLNRQRLSRRILL
ncbi:hypothetical protein EDD65_103188 [Keratinibaculum paraultunense]|uniref:Uncharacterized protein n=1 Tax=Keratinibaculum paraultunense TaxID=1278232 RepID=A0A4R3KZE4_9FIRM|nr:hypothetical protein [Keratinibaculum paraultunense]QQY80350.1 hypothetical protein JL105_03180 [Keratinibaculum paraultunense]TCS90874.1 hypothetical protein EDD65_103188 [Keratinibaculum paraultunense]